MAAILIEETKRYTFTKDNYDIYLFRYQIILGMVRFTKIVQNTFRVLINLIKIILCSIFRNK